MFKKAMINNDSASCTLIREGPLTVVMGAIMHSCLRF